MKIATRRILQRTLDWAEDFSAWANWPWAVFAVLSLKRRIGLRYWRKGQ